MRFALLTASVAVWIVLVAVPVLGQSASLNEPGEVVLRQLAAFRSNDWDSAYALASEAIRSLFDRAAFEDMVRSGYPEIARSTEATITDGDEGPDGSVYLTVVVRGVNGRSVEALYELVREQRGWRVNGVVTRPIALSV